MASLGHSNCEAIRSNFEGREAVDFAPEYLSALRSLARQWPPDLDPIDRYKEALRLEKIPYGERIERVFPDEGESR